VKSPLPGKGPPDGGKSDQGRIARAETRIARGEKGVVDDMERRLRPERHGRLQDDPLVDERAEVESVEPGREIRHAHLSTVERRRLVEHEHPRAGERDRVVGDSEH
jgi:hypothetical protein